MHKQLHEEYEKYEKYFNNHHEPLIYKILNKHDHHYQYQIDTSKYQHPKFEKQSEDQKLKRTIFALKKIHIFNHHFFSINEQRIIEPLNPGIITNIFKYSFTFMNAAFVIFMIKQKKITIKNVGMLGLAMFSQNILLKAPNFFMENIIQKYRRKQLAKKYGEIYGFEFFHEISNPAFDVERLHNLQNKLIH